MSVGQGAFTQAILDADERVTPELRTEIERLLSSPVEACAYSINRRTFAMGGEVRFSGWQNDRVVRFFRRGEARYPNRRVHADMRTAQRPEKRGACYPKAGGD